MFLEVDLASPAELYEQAQDMGDLGGGGGGGGDTHTYDPLSTRKTYVGISPSLYTASPVEKSTACGEKQQ